MVCLGRFEFALTLSGIGVGFATELAERGFNVVLHGRNPEKLQNVKKNLESRYPQRRFQVAVLDASTATIQQIEDMKLPALVILINNVGAAGGSRQWLPFTQRTMKEVSDIMAVNEGFPTLLTRHLLPKLLQPALIINVGSALDKLAAAHVEPYCGAKGHNRSFSDALRTEMAVENQQIEIMHLRVLAVATPSSREEVSLATVTPRTMAKGALDRVGCGAASTSGCFRHEILIWFMELLPHDFVAKGISELNRKKIWKG